ncbi:MULTISPECIES: LysR family transcriptional regulator [Tenebrionibacter/Tenebrionicola group]|jgi:DNA-binding transcriptional LysR family regulator|uniref:LysR family transcriptional regulator n=2 Tax=Tenebrionibacter/Tenebrionicola group TaxID=2969848 RepID=A0A8K0XYT6_9ENTR|nr:MULTISPECIES: LysR family transcriptional regulator [Tenebrionibacter/Tenebrionicola group]MBK4714889.1 LysR family transcriptional regulator [Tenebrionibacter intestinalis]MBV4412641.1 LysR family transcriptional regulator [Tenebrionicola larvae]MBV5095715.1 LysR family transcriptional regulator [Tenebrionicola larvae]
MSNDFRKLDLNLLKALDALIDEGSVTRAAQRLSLTQPAVSGMLARLREYFNDPLFVRAQRGIVPTLRAQQLAAPVKQILSEVKLLLHPASFDPSLARLNFTVAASDYALKAVIVPLMAALRSHAPGISVTVVPVESHRLLRQLEHGDIDLVVAMPQNIPEELHGRVLFVEQYVCVMRANHPAARMGSISLEQFCSLDHVLVSDCVSFTGLMAQALATVGGRRRVGMTVNSPLALTEVLLASDMLAVAPRRLVTGCAQLAVMETPVPIPGFMKSIAWHERTHRDAARRWIRSLLLEICQAKDEPAQA